MRSRRSRLKWSASGSVHGSKSPVQDSAIPCTSSSWLWHGKCWGLTDDSKRHAARTGIRTKTVRVELFQPACGPTAEDVQLLRRLVHGDSRRDPSDRERSQEPGGRCSAGLPPCLLVVHLL